MVTACIESRQYDGLRKWWILIAMSLMQAILNFDFTAMNIAVAPIARYFNADMSTMQWVLNGFLISSAIFIIFAGKLSNIFGSKKIFLFGLILFTIASMMVGTATSTYILVFGRILQGVGVSVTAPLSVSMVFDVFPERQKNIAVGLLVGVIGLSMCVGPTLGGLLIQFSNWRWIFFINLPIGIVIAWLTLAFYCRSPAEGGVRLPNVISIIVFAIFLSTFIWLLNDIGRMGFGRRDLVLQLFLPLVSLLIFILVEKKHVHPLIDYSIFKNRDFLVICIVRAVFASFGYMTIILLFGFYLQNILGYSSLTAGLVVLFMPAAYGLVSFFSGHLSNCFGRRAVLICGMVLSLLGFSLFVALPFLAKSWVTLSIPLFIVGGSLGLLLPACSTAAMASVSPHKMTEAYAIFYTCSFIGMASSIAVVGILIQKICLHFVRQSLLLANITVNHVQLVALDKVVTGAASINIIHKVFSQPVAKMVIPLAKQVFTRGYSLIMMISAVISLFGLIVIYSFVSRKTSSGES